MSDGIFVSYAHADGFRSELIAAHELPAVLATAHRAGLAIRPIVLAPCAPATVTATYRSVHDRGAR